MTEVDPFSLGGQIAKFVKIGHEYTGQVVSYSVRKQTDMDTGEVKTWTTGEPIDEVWVTMQITEDDKVNWGHTWDWDGEQFNQVDIEDDDGLRTLIVKGGLWNPFKNALRANKMKLRDTPGSTVHAVHTGKGKPSKKGYKPPKLFTVEITPGDADPFD